MKTLYVTDLDGTLLNTDRKVSDTTTALLNASIRAGALFTVATARTPATVVPLLEAVELKLPIIVMNGSFIYDIEAKKYIYTTSMPYEQVLQVIDIVEKEGKQLFVYTLKDHMLTVYYKGFNNEEEKLFYEERKALELKKFMKVTDYHLTKEHQIGHMVMIDDYEVIKKIYDQVATISGIHAVMYKDVNTTNSYLIEITKSDVNKACGINELIALLGTDEVVAFGDNLNDMQMIEMADCGCAVGNAEEALKVIADKIIDTNACDSVAKFIYEEAVEKNNCKRVQTA
ncbi:MAG: Cof-type HAD-IIB family hydrolase [Cellulosilyticaceae bacterium]